LGLCLTTVSTDAVNRAPRGTFGEVTGITQTVRYFASSLGLAVLGTILIDHTRSAVTSSLVAEGIPHAQAAKIPASFESGAVPQGQPHTPQFEHVFRLIQYDLAQSTRTVFLAMAGVMAAAFVVAVLRMQRGLPEAVPDAIEPLPEAAR